MREITLQDFDGIDLNVEDDSETRNLDILAAVASHVQYLESLEGNNVQDLTLSSKKSRKIDSVPNQLTVFGDSVVKKRRRSWLPPPGPPQCSVTDVEFRDKKLRFDRCAADVKPCDGVDEKQRFSGVEFQEMRTKFDRCDDVEEKLRQKRARDVEFRGKKTKFEACDDVGETSQRKRNRDVEFLEKRMKFDRCAEVCDDVEEKLRQERARDVEFQVKTTKFKVCDDSEEKLRQKRARDVEFQGKKTKFEVCDDSEEKLRHKRARDVEFQGKTTKFEVCDDSEEKLRQKKAQDVEFEGKKAKFEVCDDSEEKLRQKRNRDVGFREKETELVHVGAQTMIRKKRKSKEKSQEEKGNGSKRLIVKLRPPPLNLAAIATPVLPESYLRAIAELSGGRILSWGDMELVIQKKLHNSDIAKNLNRLNIPSLQVKCGDFLYDNERTFLRTHNSERKLNHMDVKIVEPSLIAGEVKFSIWKMTNEYYVFKGTWSDIVERNELKEGMLMQVWTFRVQHELWFALLKVPQIGG